VTDPERECVFCELWATVRARGHADLVAEFPLSIALLADAQLYRGYCRLILKQHVTELSRLEPAARLQYCQEMIWLSDAIFRGLGPRRMNHELLGNTVPHLHWHCVPRYLAEGEPWVRLPLWLRPEAERQVALAPETRQAVIETIRAGLGGLPGVRIPGAG
jgi:diadenosine tetraphosphate (Ap4A) HIT family hydrolase